jgi:hypothetical protein
MAAVLSELQVLSDVASEFDEVDPATRLRFLRYAALKYDLILFGDNMALAAAYVAAHMLMINKRGQKGLLGSGRVTSQTKLRDGSGTIGYAPQLLNKMSSDEALRTTSYGQEFLDLRDMLGIHGPRTLRG